MDYVKTNVHFVSYLTQFFLEWEMFQTLAVDKIITHILFSITFFLENHAICEIMWKNIVEPGRPQMTMYLDACALLAWYLRLQRHSQNM